MQAAPIWPISPWRAATNRSSLHSIAWCFSVPFALPPRSPIQAVRQASAQPQQTHLLEQLQQPARNYTGQGLHRSPARNPPRHGLGHRVRHLRTLQPTRLRAAAPSGPAAKPVFASHRTGLEHHLTCRRLRAARWCCQQLPALHGGPLEKKKKKKKKKVLPAKAGWLPAPVPHPRQFFGLLRGCQERQKLGLSPRLG